MLEKNTDPSGGAFSTALSDGFEADEDLLDEAALVDESSAHVGTKNDSSLRADSLWHRRLKPLVWGLVALAVILGGFSLWDYQTVGQYMQSTDDAFVSVEEVSVSAKLAGYVQSIAIEDNSSVQQGQTLLILDATDFTTRLDKANAEIGFARAHEAATLSSLGEARARISQAQAAVTGARAELAFLNAEMARMQRLVAAGAEPQSALDQLSANHTKAASELRAREGEVIAARERIGSVRAQAAVSRAQASMALVQRAAAQNDLASTTLKAGLAGRIGNLTARPGQFVQPGQKLMTIIPMSDLFVVANFKESQIGLMRIGQPAIVEVDALPGVQFKGVVESISPGTGATFSLVPPENATGNFTKIVQRVPVRIRIEAGPQARRVLVPGLSLEVTVDTSSESGAIEAIRREQEGLE